MGLEDLCRHREPNCNFRDGEFQSVGEFINIFGVHNLLGLIGTKKLLLYFFPILTNVWEVNSDGGETSLCAIV